MCIKLSPSDPQSHLPFLAQGVFRYSYLELVAGNKRVNLSWQVGTGANLMQFYSLDLHHLGDHKLLSLV